MINALIGTKLGMTQFFDEDGLVKRVTLVQAGPCVVTQLKTKQRDGYNAFQIGYGEAKKQPKPQAGHVKASGKNPRYLIEVTSGAATVTTDETTTETEFSVKVGDQFDASMFEIGDSVDVSGTSKGKGFAGTIKRHNFHRGPKTHGSGNYRAPGSIGAMYPEHVFKGMRMAGQMGNRSATVKHLSVVAVDAANNILALNGSVPGAKKNIILIRKVV